MLVAPGEGELFGDGFVEGRVGGVTQLDPVDGLEGRQVEHRAGAVAVGGVAAAEFGDEGRGVGAL